MKKLLNTLYVSTQGAYLHKVRETIAVKIDGENKLNLPIHAIESIICFGVVSVSPFLLHHCAEQGISISFFTEYGKFLARVQGAVKGNVLLRREQYRFADDKEKALKISINILTGKLNNSRAVLRRFIRDYGENAKVSNIEKRLTYYLKTIKKTDEINILRGVEGEAAAGYFSVLNELIRSKEEEFIFNKRSRRPPLDPVNALLSFIYTLLTHDCRSALEGVGLDPYVGYLHVERPGRPSLALDVMEEFRAYLADRLMLSLINRQQIKKGDFKYSENGAVILSDKGRKELLKTWQKRKQEEISHPFLNEKCKIGLLPHVQAKLLSRYLRGDLDGYPPFLWK